MHTILLKLYTLNVHLHIIFITKEVFVFISGGPPTVKGDERLSNFNTTHNLMFPDKSQPRVKILSAVSVTCKEWIL